MSKPRVKAPKSAKVGDTIQVKTLISHKMETGNRKDKKTGKKIPRLIISSFTAKFNGKDVFKGDIHPAISANPYFAFFMKFPGAGELELTWTDDNGKAVTAKKKIAAA